MKRRKRSYLLGFATVVWSILLVGSFWRLFVYANTPGAPGESIATWPLETKIKRHDGKATLVLFAHPRCPCSKASVAELSRLIPFSKDKIENFVVFVKPKGLTDDWAKEDLWREAVSMPEVSTILDEGGIEADRFGAKTSGQVMLYDRSGNLVFHGGITPARGHMGDSIGRDAVLAVVEKGQTSLKRSSAFGCSLKNPERAIAGARRETQRRR